LINNRYLNIIEEFDNSEEIFNEDDIYYELDKLKLYDSQLNVQEKSELVAFMLTDGFYDKDSRWGLYYGPRYVYQNDKEYPSLSDITKDTFEYWRSRTKQVSNPVLKSRYCDLMIEFSEKLGEKFDHTLYKDVIENNLLIYSKKIYDNDLYISNRLKRTFKLALKIKDSDNIIKAIKVIIEFERSIDDDLIGVWGLAADLLLLNKNKYLSDEDKEDIIDLLETRVKRISSKDPEKINSDALEKAITQLALYYTSINKNEDVIRLLEILENSFFKILKDQDAIQRHNYLDRLHNLFIKFNLVDKDIALMSHIKNETKNIVKEMKETTFSVKIEQKELKDYVDHFLKFDLEGNVKNFVSYHIPFKEEIEKILKREAKEFPFQYSFEQIVIGEEGLPLTKIGTLENDFGAHVINKFSEIMKFQKPFLHLVLEAFVDTEEFTTEFIINRIDEKLIDGKLEILTTGLNAYFEKKYITAISVLIPQIESMFRLIVELSGGNILKRNRNGNIQLTTFDQILREDVLKEIFTEDVMLYLRILFTDQRGWNLRNNVCHGIINEHYFTKYIADRVIHTILMLGSLNRNNL
jgi:hypothetical protein